MSEFTQIPIPPLPFDCVLRNDVWDMSRDDEWDMSGDDVWDLGSNDVCCGYCGERNHTHSECKHGTHIQCDSCHEYGHKAKNVGMTPLWHLTFLLCVTLRWSFGFTCDSDVFC
jgi:hypothetical protein